MNPVASNQLAAPPVINTGSAPRKRILFLAGALAAVSAAVVLFQFNPAEHAFYPACTFHQLTGLQCPGCGSTRALHQLLHGHVVTALHLNALLVLALPALAAIIGRHLVLKQRSANSSFSLKASWAWWLLAAAAAFGVLRNLPGFEWLSP